ncbi:hypothetical protein GCM10027416_18430 [Okibacterium endophyticum]
MKRIPPVVSYTVLRLLAFIVPLGVLLATGFNPYIAALTAALIGLSLSILVLRRPREAISRDLYAVRHRETPPSSPDEDVEDAIDIAGTTAPADDAQPSERSAESHHDER